MLAVLREALANLRDAFWDKPRNRMKERSWDDQVWDRGRATAQALARRSNKELFPEIPGFREECRLLRAKLIDRANKHVEERKRHHMLRFQRKEHRR